MYRRLKNILGVSLMVLAIVIAQIPMPEAQADTIREMTETDLPDDDTSAHVVTFSMNGGTFSGVYNNYSFQDKTPVLVIDDGKVISSFPDDKLASYSGYKTETDTWYTDKECLIRYDTDSSVTQSMTLYKKWYNVTSDGTTLADKGFHISADGTVLYRYDGREALAEIPQTVAVIAGGAFAGLDQNVRGVVLPAGIKDIGKNAFGGLKDGSIIYIYDSDTTASKDYAKQLSEEYEQLVYSEYLDPEKTGEIAGIDYQDGATGEEGAETPEGVPGPAESSEADPVEKEPESTESGSDTESSESKITVGIIQGGSDSDNVEPTENEPVKTDSTESASGKDDSGAAESGSEEDSTAAIESSTETETETETSSVIIVEPDQKYTVTFDTGLSDVQGEKREVLGGRTVSELVSVNDEQPRILRKENYQIQRDDGKQDIVYTFQGWYKDSAYTAEWDFANDIIEQDTTIYAKWDRQTRAYFYVTFDTAEGHENAANMPDKQKLYEDENLKKPSKNPSLKNKTFEGWYTSADDTGAKYKSWGKPVTKDMTLYAHFAEKSNTVIFHMNGGGFTGTYDGTSYTDAASLKARITVGKGITASEYPVSGSSAGFKYSNYATDSNWYKDKECLEVYRQKDSGGNDTVVKSDLTLYKKWYYTSSGFTMNTSSNVLYKYSGSVADVTIPNTVTIIGSDAFASVGSISTITLPDNISEVKDNAFSGVKNVSKDITITGKTEAARNVAKGLANQYTHLVYKETNASKETDNDSAVVSSAESGSIKLGATISGSASATDKAGAAGNNTGATANNTPVSGTIALGAGNVNVVTGTPSAASQPSASQSAASQPSASQSAVVSRPAASQNTISNASAPAAQGTKTTQKQNVTSASAPKGTQHIKDSTPKTGDPLQYRMLIVCAMFSVGVLLILTGNGKRKRSSAS